ncbi:peptidoglycan-binding domain-containing protein [Cryptosporangium aurantiacum]|uniref:Peptidoglycan-binding (PGRP) domain of peptidoglycan hydrolases-containing protein n=1 Tax=Cryptosporangium aurantiacum TaxID=134849 RepID=A0A1M7J9Q4_9ACTN|nr:peptidoglycan-binding protein [Cryptosporangium aurantiacum]SHM49755.1 Peptidoglycan-binding (PGRP) domain of peptidoglycan hydrolases-containing protein [Cryptosporangium aurantiacum]
MPRLRRLRALGAALALSVVTGIAAAPVAASAAAPVKTPSAPAKLPSGIEALAPYVAQTSCEWVDKPGAIAFGALLKATYPDTSYGVTRSCTGTMSSEHYDGRAVDWMNSIRKPSQAAQATAVLNWLFATDSAGNKYANARRLGVMYIIWDGRIWGSYNAAWKPYSTCASHPEASWDTTCHRDHVHFSLSWAGAMKRTSFWTGSVAANDFGPCRTADLNYAAPYRALNAAKCTTYATLSAPAGSPAAYAGLVKFSGAQLQSGASGNAVKALQAALGLTADGAFGPKTAAAVVSFKTAHKLPGTAVVDAATWRALLAAHKPAPPAAKPSTPAAKPATPAATAKPATAKPAAPNPLTQYRDTVLKYGSKGAAVTALQRRLKLPTVTGTFATKTQNAVKIFQRTHHLPVTGIVDRKTWTALGA